MLKDSIGPRTIRNEPCPTGCTGSSGPTQPRVQCLLSGYSHATKLNRIASHITQTNSYKGSSSLKMNRLTYSRHRGSDTWGNAVKLFPFPEHESTLI